MSPITRIELPSRFGSVFEEGWSISLEGQHIAGTYLTKQTGNLTTSDYHAFLGQSIRDVGSVFPRGGNLMDVPAQPAEPGVLRVHDYVSFDYLNESATSGRGINDHGDHVGFYRDAGGANRAYVCWRGRSDPEPFDLATAVFAPNASMINNACFGVNNRGRVVGVVTDANGMFGFIARGRQGSTGKGFDRKFAPPGWTRSNARAINSFGDVIGTYVQGGKRHGFVALSPALTETPFDYPGAVETIGAGINDKRGVVGSYVDATGGTHGYTGWIDDIGILHAATQFDIPYAIETRLDGIAADGTVIGSYVDGTRLGDARLDEPVNPLPRRYAFISSSNLLDLARR